MTDAPTPAVALRVGDAAPDFTLRDQHGSEVSLAAFRGRKHVVVVFYPFAFSGICTGELGEIRDRLEDFDADDLQVLTVSCDPMFAQRAWADQEAYFFPLLSDFWPHGETARAYGVLDEAGGHALRGTFLIDTDGVVRYAEVLPAGQARDFEGYRAALAGLRAG
ncbi:MAG: peroxiredoxin [Micrococcales bacterium]|nr:peroxiredoxin [Micrococcales bacterium]